MINKNNHIDSTLKNAFQELVTPEVSMLHWDVIEGELQKKDRRAEIVRLSFSFFLILLFMITNVKLHRDADNYSFSPIQIENPPIFENNISITSENHKLEIPQVSLNYIIADCYFGEKDETFENTDAINNKLFEILTLQSLRIPNFGFSNVAPDGNLISFMNIDNLLSKEEDEPKNNNLRIEVIGSASPNTIGRIVSENVNLAGLIHKDYRNNVLGSENAGLSMNYGLAANFSINKWMFGLGLNVLQWRENIDYNYSIDYDIDVNLTENRIDNYVLRPVWRREQISLNRINEYNFVEIPVYVGYKLYIGPRLEWRNRMGLILTQMTSKNGELADYTTLSVMDVNDLNRWRNSSLSTQISSGIYYHKNRYFVGLEPFYSVGVSSITNNEVSALNVRPFNYGLHLNAGFTIKSDKKK